MANPNTHREALIAELLGDVGALAGSNGRPESVFPGGAEEAAGKVRSAGEMAAGGVTAAGERFLSVFDERGPHGPARRPGSRRRGAGGGSGG